MLYSISYKKYLSFPLSKINLNFPASINIKNKVVNFSNYPDYLKYTKHINKDTLFLLTTTNPLNSINLFTYSKYYKIEPLKFPFLSYISDFYSYEYKDSTPTAIYSVLTSSVSIADQHRFKILNFKPFSEVSLNNLIPFLILKETSLKNVHKQIVSSTEGFNFNLQNVYNVSPKNKQLLIQLHNYNNYKLL